MITTYGRLKSGEKVEYKYLPNNKLQLRMDGVTWTLSAGTHPDEFLGAQDYPTIAE